MNLQDTHHDHAVFTAGKPTCVPCPWLIMAFLSQCVFSWLLPLQPSLLHGSVIILWDILCHVAAGGWAFNALAQIHSWSLICKSPKLHTVWLLLLPLIKLARYSLSLPILATTTPLISPCFNLCTSISSLKPELHREVTFIEFVQE